MRKNFKYRMYPSKKQVKQLNASLGACRFVWNNFLAERKTKYEKEKISLSLYDQLNTLPHLKKQYLFLKNAHSQCLQNVGTRIELAFQAFFRRIKAGETPGFPRFKSAHRFHSLTFPQYGNGCKLASDGKTTSVCLSKIGSVPIKYHREIVGIPKTINISRTPTGKWFISISCEYKPLPLPTLNNSVGLDMGLENFATDQQGQVIENPNFFRKDEKKLAKVRRKMDKYAKGTPERAKARKAVAHCHERTAWRRDNFCHQESCKIVNKYQIVVTEDLSIKKMSETQATERNKSIRSVAWGKFLDMLSAKAVEAGRAHIKVNPAYTSQDCSRCNQNRQEMPSKIRVYRCPKCGLELHRDHNAACNILRLGMQSLVIT